MIIQPYHTEVGAGTSNPATLLRVLGPEPWRAAYVEPSIRPDDGRYGENPYRFQQHYQYQVILKPAPDDVQDHLPRLAAGDRDPDRAARRAVRRGQLGEPQPGRVGARVGGVDGRDGDHPVHLLPAGRRDRARPGVGRDHLRPRAAGDVPPGRPPCARHGVVAGRHAGRTCARQNERQISAYNYELADTDDACPPLRRARGRGGPLPRGGAAAAGLRPRAQVLARVQPARLAPGDRGHRPGGLHPADAAADAGGRGRASRLGWRRAGA